MNLHTSHPRARIEHDCMSCGRTIKPGETYERQDNVFDGARYSYKACRHCQVATKRALAISRDSYYWDEGISSDVVHDVLRDEAETLGDIRLSIGMRRRWTHKDGTLWAVPTMTEKAA